MLNNKKSAITVVGLHCRLPNSHQKIAEQICRQIMENPTKQGVVVRDLKFLNIEWDFLNSIVLNGTKFVTCIQEYLLKQRVNISTGEESILDFILVDEPCMRFQISA